jgi:predicted TIM-barrel fold metal-dependent hydrolase
MTSAWLKAPEEAALSPDIAIVDAHHHFWGEAGLGERFGRFLPEDVAAMIAKSGHQVVATVYLECFWNYRTTGPEHLRCVGETESVEAAAKAAEARGGRYPKLAAGIVSLADLLLGDGVGDVLDAHIAASPTRFRGIRHVTAADPDEPLAGDSRRGQMLDAKFRAGMAQVARRDLIFETWCVHTQFADFLSLADAFPNATMVLDHLVTPVRVGRFRGKDQEVLGAWRTGVAEAARRPNVVLKIGGLGMPGAGFGWFGAETPPGSAEIAAAYQPYFAHAVETFGVERCILESNFAVDGGAYGYSAIWNAFKRLAASLSASEQKALFHDTAARIYKLKI